jgi:hypothetical protein
MREPIASKSISSLIRSRKNPLDGLIHLWHIHGMNIHIVNVRSTRVVVIDLTGICQLTPKVRWGGRM